MQDQRELVQDECRADTDRPFSRDELLRRGQDLFPGCRFEILGGPRGIGLVWVDSGA
jgi:hypothetical protein